MTRKDYTLIARALEVAQDTHPDAGGEHGAADQWWCVVVGISAALAYDNPQFDKAKFLTACGCPAIPIPNPDPGA